MILDYCDVIEMLSHHSDVRCREKALDIMKWIFDKFQPPFADGKNRDLVEQLANLSRICLIKGMLLFYTRDLFQHINLIKLNSASWIQLPPFALLADTSTFYKDVDSTASFCYHSLLNLDSV